MKPYNVLIPTDFSEDSLRAIDAALELRASHPNMKITLLNVVESLAVPGDPIVAYLPVIEHQIKSSQQLLENLVSKYKWSFDIPIECVVEVGSPWQFICHIAEEIDARFIVLSTHGRTGLSRVFMGSVAEQVVRHSTCPVMVIHAYAPKKKHHPEKNEAQPID